MFYFVNPKTGKEFEVSEEIAGEVLGPGNGNRFVCLPYSGSPISKEKNIKKIKMPGTCVIRMGGLGDLIMLSSGLSELKKRMKGKPLTFGTKPENIPFMGSMPFVDRCLSVDSLTKYEFERTIDLRFAVEPKELGTICKGTWESYTQEDRSDAFDKLLGVYPAPKRFIVPGNGDGPIVQGGYILIVASIVAPARSIFPAYVGPLAKEIVREYSIPVVLTGMSQPWNKDLKTFSSGGVKNLIDKTTTKDMINLCSHARVVITPDSGPLHIAGALGVKTLGIFGAINPRTRISYYPSVRALYPHGEKKCIPCWDLHPCMKKAEDFPPCMKMLKPSRIIREMEALL